MAAQFLTEAELAEQLHLHPMTLKAWRLAGRGPRSIKFPGKKPGTGYSVRYRPEDIDEWLAAIAIKREVDQPSSRAKRGPPTPTPAKRSKRGSR
jgi:hypothetical protein